MSIFRRPFTSAEIATIQRAQIESLCGRTAQPLPPLITQNLEFNSHLKPSPTHWLNEAQYQSHDNFILNSSAGGSDWTNRILEFNVGFDFSQPALLIHIVPLLTPTDSRSRLAAIRYGEYWDIQFALGGIDIFKLSGALNGILLKLQDRKRKKRGSLLYVLLRVSLGQCKLVADLITSFVLLGEDDGEAALCYADKMPLALADILESLSVMKVPLVCDFANFVMCAPQFSPPRFYLTQTGDMPANVSKRHCPTMQMKRFFNLDYSGMRMICYDSMVRLFSSTIRTGYVFRLQDRIQSDLIYNFHVKCLIRLPFSAILIRTRGFVGDDFRRREVNASIVSLSAKLVEPTGSSQFSIYSLGNGWYCLPARNSVPLEKALFGTEWNENETRDNVDGDNFNSGSVIVVCCQLQEPCDLDVELFYRGANLMINKCGVGGLMQLGGI
jgi:hypothetical protein